MCYKGAASGGWSTVTAGRGFSDRHFPDTFKCLVNFADYLESVDCTSFIGFCVDLNDFPA